MSNLDQIQAGSIVEVCGEVKNLFFGYQGYVVCPHSGISDKGGCKVAVFFGSEVKAGLFNTHRQVESWDAKNRDMLLSVDFSTLLADDKWRTCPRVVYIHPSNLKVSKGWSIKTLSKRFFGDNPHSIYSFCKGISENPSLYRCFIENCDAPATRMTVYNVWGSVFPIHLCDSCCKKYSGIMTDGQSQKVVMKLLDGTEVI